MTSCSSLCWWRNWAVKRSPVAADLLKSAIALWPEVIDATVPLCALQEKLGRYYADTEIDLDRDQAIPLLTAGAEDYRRRGHLDRYRSMLRRAASVHLKLGRITRAESVLEPFQKGEDRTVALDLQCARIALAKGNAGEALEYLHEASGRVPTSGEAVEAHLLRAEAHSQRAMWRDAGRELQDAVRSAQTVTNTSAVVRAALTRLRLDYWWMRRLDPSAADLDGKIRKLASPSQVDELDVWQLFLRPDQAHAQRRAVSNLGGSDAHGRVRLILMLSHVLPELPAQLWETLLDQAARIPSSARIVALMEPVLLGKPPKVPDKYRRAIAESLRGEPEGPEEAAWHGVRYGQLLAWLGLPDEAQELLRSSIPRPSFIGAVLPWQRVTYRERRRIEQRMRDWGVSVRPEPDPPDFWASVWRHTPFRRAAATIENARRAADEGDWRAVDTALKLCADDLAQAPFRTAFHEIADQLRNPAARTSGQFAGVDRTVPAQRSFAETAEVERLEPQTAGTNHSVLAMRPQAGRLAVRVSGGPDEDNLVSSDGPGLEIMLRSRGIPRRLTGMSLADLTGELRIVVEQSRADFSRDRTLCLRTPLGSLSAAPWELAMPEYGALLWRSPSGWLQDAGRGMREYLLAELHTAKHFGPSGRSAPVTMIAPMSQQDRESPEAGLYSNLARSSGVEVVREIDPERDPISLLYIASCFAEPSTLMEPVIAGTEITASLLAERLERSGRKPVVILDVPAVRTESNLLHQLLLRNYFAQVLLDSSTVRCVIATGLLTGVAMQRIHELLTGSGVRFTDRTQAQIVEEIRNISYGQPATTALFTSLPDLPWLPPAVPVL